MHIEFTNNLETVKINGIEYEPKHKRYTSGRFPSDECESCGRDTFKTLNSRNIDGYRFRRKECLYCGHRWDTIEYIYRGVKGRPRIDKATKDVLYYD